MFPSCDFAILGFDMINTKQKWHSYSLKSNFCLLHLLQVSLKEKIWSLYPCETSGIWGFSWQLLHYLTNPAAIWSFAGVHESVSHDFTKCKHCAPQMFLRITSSHWIHLCVNVPCVPHCEVVFQPPNFESSLSQKWTSSCSVFLNEPLWAIIFQLKLILSILSAQSFVNSVLLCTKF